jgi:phage repressor protein C with HTH and peptisase S24 domain
MVDMIGVDMYDVVSGMSTPGSRLKEARLAKYPSAAKAAEALGMKTSSYAAHENGQNGFDADHALRYARKFKVSAAWLLTGEESDPKRVPLGEEFDPDPAFDDHPSIGSETGRRGIPEDGIAQIDVTGGMGGGGVSIVNPGVPGKHGMTFAAEHIRDYWRLPVEVLVALGLRPGDIAIIPVQGDSMTGTLTEGDFVFVDTRHRLPSPDGIYALTDEFGGVIVKRLEIASNPRDEDVVIRIISDNPRHAPKERALSDINIMGRVVRRFGGVG